MNWNSLIGLVLNFGASTIVGTDFKIYWNVPSSNCSERFRINVTETLVNNGVLVNTDEKFEGDKIVLFYQTKFGKYPYIDNEGHDINGGLPELGNLKKHLEVAKQDIKKVIPNSRFNGLAVIDWEKWRPTWLFNWGKMQIYRNRTLELMTKKHPAWSRKRILTASIRMWEETARKWMQKTIKLGKKMRPKGRWCYYIFPDCYNYYGRSFPEQFYCNSTVKHENDRLFWLWDSATALCPSIYDGPKQGKYNETQEVWYLYGRLSEAKRVSRPEMPVYAYINYRMLDKLHDVPKKHFWLMMSYAASLGLDGVVIWGSSEFVETKEDCEDLETYVKKVIAPAARKISTTVKWCGKKFCDNNGLCTWPKQPFTSWKCLIYPASCTFSAKDITCRCQIHEGRYCNITK
nr:hyaluronidase [Hemiscorpius lepturus]